MATGVSSIHTRPLRPSSSSLYFSLFKSCPPSSVMVSSSYRSLWASSKAFHSVETNCRRKICKIQSSCGTSMCSSNSLHFRKDTLFTSSVVEKKPGNLQWQEQAETIRRGRVGGPSTKCTDGAGLNSSYGRSTKKDIEQKFSVFSYGNDFNKEKFQMHLARNEVVVQNSRNTMMHPNFTEEARRPLPDVENGVSQLEAVHKLSQDKAFSQSGRHAVITENVPPLLEKINGHETDTPQQLDFPLTRGSEKVKPNKTQNLHERLTSLYSKVFVVNCVPVAKKVVWMLTTWYRHLVHVCDTEVANIDVKQETPVDHGEIICFSIYCGPEADFGNGKSCIWVDVLDGGGKEILAEFAPFFEDPSIKKVWHNYSFDHHIVENYGLKVAGFHADTMHMARLWDSSRRAKGGYSLEALTSDSKVMSGAQLYNEKELIGKVSMKTIFGKKKLKKDGSAGKITTVAPVDVLQREERIPWICYSALDAITTLKLYESLRKQLSNKAWTINGEAARGKSMFDFYQKYWQPFGELLVKMETEGMLVDRAYLAEVEKIAKREQEVAVNRFRKWASMYCPDAKYMNVGSDTQLRQLLFGGIQNSKDPNVSLPAKKTLKIPNIDKVIEEGKKAPTKFRNITLNKIDADLPAEVFTASGWPSVSISALKILAGKVSAEFDFMDYAEGSLSSDDSEDDVEVLTDDVAEKQEQQKLAAFEDEAEGKEACHAIAALCEVCAIDSLISNFILPLQGSNISGKDGRIHCSLNINTETGRLSARRPNLQNQPALEKDRYKIRQAFIAAPGNSLIVADYGQLELRILAHLANCKSMLDAFKAGGDFHSRTALNMYPHIREAVDKKQVLLEWDPQPGEDKPPVPLLKDAFASERRKAKMLNFSIAYGKTPVGLSRDWKVSVEEAKETVALWYKERQEVLIWQDKRKKEAHEEGCVRTLLGRARWFPSLVGASYSQRGHIERAAINTPVQGSAADVAMCAMLEISTNKQLKELGWRLLLQVHDEVILEGPSESAEVAKAIVNECMSKPFNGRNILNVDLAVDAKCAQNWYAAK
ncbi:DNA polymerase I A, chloroplastic/mitochondrial-like isoform X1 [Humulus lupulus]|uniref:DNA polymerase I A, chloroplastic/mitochondrial-like isoform X1 n=1 Tax=Humulus lupulus TaxID=3486 RepID=UPI002B40666C|nr:DNA polymerase I A, chloroplastic/mitochondrial-like isoform X1 [Humulus lupulus]